jgi:hypothetical protein
MRQWVPLAKQLGLLGSVIITSVLSVLSGMCQDYRTRADVIGVLTCTCAVALLTMVMDR